MCHAARVTLPTKVPESYAGFEDQSTEELSTWTHDQFSAALIPRLSPQLTPFTSPHCGRPSCRDQPQRHIGHVCHRNLSSCKHKQCI